MGIALDLGSDTVTGGKQMGAASEIETLLVDLSCIIK
jgi:hypothetical protein